MNQQPETTMRGVIITQQNGQGGQAPSGGLGPRRWAAVPGVVYPAPPATDAAPEYTPIPVDVEPPSAKWCSMAEACKIMQAGARVTREACRRAAVHACVYQRTLYLYRADVQKAAEERCPIVSSLLWDSVETVMDLLQCSRYVVAQRMADNGIKSIRARVRYADGTVSRASRVLYNRHQIESTFSS